MTAPAPSLLQPLAWPDPDLFADAAAYLRPDGDAAVSVAGLRLGDGAGADFDTYFNLFNIGKWIARCDLPSVGLRLAGTGRARVEVRLHRPETAAKILLSETLDLSDTAGPVSVPLPREVVPGVLSFSLRAEGPVTLTGGGWTTDRAPRRLPDLVLAITTFRREAAVAATVARFRAFAGTSAIGDHLHLIVVDNGRSADIASGPRVTVLGNENLGGAGGFARGLMAARDRGASHCLFMDDDAAVPMDAILRTWAFLAHASDPATAVAGAMAATRQPWELWENGAVFDRACRPRFGGTDLRDADEVLAMEYATTVPAPAGFYGGWWFFAFPLAAVRHLPFPFFVRGDDVGFSLAHDFAPVTLPGVISLQQGFTEKDSPLTWYLDLRSHLAHHLSLPSMDIGATATTGIGLWFWVRTLLVAHYETMAAVNLALEDVLRGPGFFAAHPDLGPRRAQIAALTQAEAWGDLPALPDRQRIDPQSAWQRLAMKVTLNGHLLPGFARIGNHVTLPAHLRWNPRRVWGAARITYRDETTGASYRVTHSKARAWRESRRTARLLWRFWRGYRGLRAQWQAAYPEMTGDAFWTRALGLEPSQTMSMDPAMPSTVERSAR